MNVEIELARRMLLRSSPIYVIVPILFYFIWKLYFEKKKISDFFLKIRFETTNEVINRRPRIK